MAAGRVLPEAKQSPVATVSSRAKPSVSPSLASPTRVVWVPRIETSPAMRLSAPLDPITVSPSLKPPRSTRETESLPPWLVCRVFITWASGPPVSAMPSRARVSGRRGASWRSAFKSRVTPLPRSAEPISTGTTWRSRSSWARSSKTRSFGGSISEMRSSISASS